MVFFLQTWQWLWVKLVADILTSGWFWLCGTNVSKSLPPQQTGTCTIARLAPSAFWSQDLTFNFQHNHYPVGNLGRVSKPTVRRPSKFPQFVRAPFPNLGVTELERAVISISATLEITQNATVDVLKNLQMKINSLLQLATVTGESLIIVVWLTKRVLLMIKWWSNGN